MKAKAAELLRAFGFDAHASHRDVEEALLGAGWTPCGAGDWAIALRSPGGDVAARISPFDPMGGYTAEFYARAAATGLVPELYAHHRLYGGGDLQFMEFLLPVPLPEAQEFLTRFSTGDPELAELRRILYEVHAWAQAELPYCGPHDDNPSNVMMSAAGIIKLADPYYADGPNLYKDAGERPELVAARIPKAQREFMTEIPLAGAGGWDPAGKQRILTALAKADAALATE